MNINFTASESLKILVEEQSAPIHHYLRQPQRLVKAIASPKLMTQLSDNIFRLKMRPLNFMEIYHFQPMVTLKVWSDADGKVNLRSEDCEINIDYINDRFTMNLQGELFPCQIDGQTYLQGRADLQVKVDLPPALWLTPKALLEPTGNKLLKSVLLRIKQRLLSQLITDYYHWANSNTEQSLNQSTKISPVKT